MKSNYHFLNSLAYFILEKYGADLLYLSKVTILLPSRRSCRIIKDVLLKQLGKNAVILPNIKAIGDVDYDEIGVNFLEDNINDISDILLTPSSNLKYRCLLIEEIRKFNEKTGLFGSYITTNQIDLIASNLEDFLSEVDREELDLDNLENVDDSTLASHKQKILSFLRYFGSNWRNILQKNNVKSVSSYQREIMDLRSDLIRRKNPEYPIIVAGSTGSMKSTARFIKAVSELENGFVFLYGLDIENTQSNIGTDIAEKIEGYHPQFMLRKLLNFLEVDKKEVKNLSYEQFKLADDVNNKFLSYAFLHAENTDIWKDRSDINANAVKNLTLVECKNIFEEATAISLMMVRELQDDEKNIALVTSNKNLASLVKQILVRFGVYIDNSKDSKLIDSDFVYYLLFVASFVSDEFSIGNLLTILKNKHSRAGFKDEFYLDNLKIFEIEILRKNFSLKNLEIIAKKVSEYGDDNLSIWFKKVKDILDEFKTYKNIDNFLELVLKNFDIVQKLTAQEDNLEKVYEISGVEEFLNFVEELGSEVEYFKVEGEVYHKFLRQTLSQYKLDLKQNHHPRLHILSPIEARVVNFDVMIIANLNENEFVIQSGTQNWLSRSMRLDFGLSDLSTKTGISAFDFVNYLSNKKVYLTRSLTSDNAPTRKLNFLLKVETLLKASSINAALDRGDYWHFLIEEFNKFEFFAKKSDLVQPNIENPIRKFSVTDVGKWIRDPYYIYAKRVLNLKKLNNIDEEASFANFGNFVHEALENFVKDYNKIDKLNKLEALINIYGKPCFNKYFPNDDSYLLWWPRFENIAKWFVKNELKIRENLKEVFVEKSAKIKIDGVDVTTKIDRINVNHEGEIEIIDYKTGLIPKKSDIKSGIEPQLPLEALILLQSENKDVSFVKNLAYYSLKGRDKNSIEDISDTGSLVSEAVIGIKELIDIFNNKKHPFISSPNLDIYKENEFSHLARVEVA